MQGSATLSIVSLFQGWLYARARTCAGEQALRVLQEDAPGQVGVPGLVRSQLQGVQEGRGAPGGQVCGRAHRPCQVLSHPAPLIWLL